MNKLKFPMTKLALAVLVPTLPGLVAAQQAGALPDSTAMSLGEVTVTSKGGPLETSNVLSSVSIVPTERVENEVVVNNWQLFGQVPGVMLTQYGMGTTSGKLSMRGFNGEGEINAVKLLIDGVPSNSNDGNMPYIDLVPQLDIESLEVVKGTSDPRYGLYSIAGNANITTKRGGNYTLGRLTAGSFGTAQGQAALGVEDEGMTQNYAVSRQTARGYRDHAMTDSTTFAGKWFAKLGNDSRIGLLARHHAANAQESGYLTAVQAHENPTQSPAYSASDEDRRRMTQVAIQAEGQVSEAVYASGQLYLNDIYDLRYVKFSSAVSQQERFVDETHRGASTQLTWRLGETALGQVTLSGGLNTERQSNASDRYSTVDQVRTAQTREQTFDFNNSGGFLQAMLGVTPKLTLVPAYRADVLSGTYTNRLTGVTYEMNNYGVINQPKLGAIYVLNDATSLYGSWGRTFQVGVGTASYKVANVDDLEPSINQGWEVGAKFRAAAKLDGRVAFWEQVASNEARRKLNDPNNDAENIGKTRRQGVDVELNGRPAAGLSWWAATALQRSKILKADAASPATEGKEIDHVPHLLYGLGVDYRMNAQWRLSAWGQGQSNYYLERTNATGEFGAYAVLNASATYQFSERASLEVQVRNLADQYYEYVWYDGTQSLHSPAPGRSVYAMFNLRL